MREGASYRGVRAKLPATIGVARVVVTLDFSFGDPGEVEEIRYPEILGGAGIALYAYPIERTLAEKIATMMERGELNTRDRDFADVWVLSRIHTIGAVDLRATLPKTDGRVLRTRTPPAPEPARPRDHQQRPKRLRGITTAG
jgi:hypothetical protein